MSDSPTLKSNFRVCLLCFEVVIDKEVKSNMWFFVQAQHAPEENEPHGRQFQVGGSASGVFTSGHVGQWGSYADIRGDSVSWDDIEHVGLGMPTACYVVGGHDNSQNKDRELDMGLDLALNGHSFYQ